MIQLHDLSLKFSDGSGIAYRDTGFESGKSYVLLGASGCGKSTLLNLIAGVLSPTAGSIEIDGQDMTKISRSARDAYRIAHIGYIFQDYKLLEEMSVADNIGILTLEHVDISRMDELLQELNILPLKKRRVSKLSGGERQRVAIVRALVKTPDLILADEPTGNLNYAIGRKVMEELVCAAKGKTLLCVTHDERMTDLFDYALNMDDLASAFEEGGARHA